MDSVWGDSWALTWGESWGGATTPVPPDTEPFSGEVVSRRRRKPEKVLAEIPRKKDDAEAIALAVLFLWE